VSVLHTPSCVRVAVSQGFGHGPLDSLPGKCGTQDVADVLAATQHVLAMDPPIVDAERVVACGGSHGGFLGLHMVGQHPSLFKVRVDTSTPQGVLFVLFCVGIRHTNNLRRSINLSMLCLLLTTLTYDAAGGLHSQPSG